MKVISDNELYESLMLDYQVTEVARLNQVLERNGIVDPELRKAICAEFADANGSFLDQGWFEGLTSGRYWPELAFSKRPLDPRDGLGAMQELVLPEYASNFHDYVSGAIEYYFQEHQESLGDIQTGYV